MRHHLVRGANLISALFGSAALLSGCFSDAQDVSAGGAGATSVGATSSGASGSDTSGSGTSGSAGTGSGSTSSATEGSSTADATTSGASGSSTAPPPETTGAGTSTTSSSSDATSGSTGVPAICEPDEMATECAKCIGPLCCEPFVACADDRACACYIVCLGYNGTKDVCAAECAADPGASPTVEIIGCMKQACGDVCKTG